MQHARWLRWSRLSSHQGRLCEWLERFCATPPASQSVVHARSEHPVQRRAYSNGLVSTGVLKRFYKDASVAESTEVPGRWNVLLDGRRVKTPQKEVLLVPSRMLAMAAAAEFQYQSADLVRPITQPIYRLLWQSQDAPRSSQDLIDQMLQYIDCDPVCARQPARGATVNVARRQAEVYDPIIGWAEATFGVRLAVSDSILGTDQEPDVALAYAQHLGNQPYATLVALAELTGAVKSLLIGFAAARGELTVEQAVAAARVEEDLQMAEFGLVEGGHDLDIVDLRTRVAGAALFLRLLDVDRPAAVAPEAVSKSVDRAMANLRDLGF